MTNFFRAVWSERSSFPGLPDEPSAEDLHRLFIAIDSDHDGWVSLGDVIELIASRESARDVDHYPRDEFDIQTAC